jgi:hypothetical protein
MMQAVLLAGHGGLDKLELRRNLPIPVPAQPDRKSTPLDRLNF